MQLHARGPVAAPLAALALVAVQAGVLRFAPSDMFVRVLLPATIAAVPLALWPLRHRFGVWIMFVGIAANLSVIVVNGGLMPIRLDTVRDAVGSERAAKYHVGAWLPGSKDVLVAPGSGHALALRDSIVVGTDHGGMVISPGDIVVWSGLVVLAAETSIAWHARRRRAEAAQSGVPAPKRAAGGAAT